MLRLENYLPLEGVRANLVQGANGVTADENGSSRGISNALDRELLLHLRSLSDCLVTDGETARIENYRVPNVCDLAIITRRGFVPKAGTSDRNFININAELPEAISQLRASGYSRLLLETGPKLLEVSWQNIDELCLTNTAESQPDLAALGISSARMFARQVEGDSTFTVWREIQGF